MEQTQKISCLARLGFITSHSLALILISWYLLIQVGVVQYDAADLFGAVLLLSLPTAVLLLVVQLIDLMGQSSRNILLIWGCTVSGLMILVSAVAWVQLILFFSSLSGTFFG